MLCPSETMLLLFVINYTFVLDARVLSMNKCCAILISHNNNCLTIVMLVLSFRLMIYEAETKERSPSGLWKRLHKEKTVSDWTLRIKVILNSLM